MGMCFRQGLNLARPLASAYLVDFGDDLRGARQLGARHRATYLYSVDPRDLDHDAVMRIGGRAPERWAHSTRRPESHSWVRVTTTSDRHRMPATFTDPGDKPTRLAHLDDRDQRGFWVERSERSAQVVRLLHGAPSGCRCRVRVACPAARPIASTSATA